jgi:serine protease Do
MKQLLVSLLAVALLTQLGSFAQTTSKGEKGEKSGKGEKVETKEITILKKEGSKKETMNIVIDGDNITINGKPADEYRGNERIVIDEDIIINGNRVVVPGKRGSMTFEGTGTTRPLLGVTTDKDDKGLVVMSVSDNSGAQKAGLKEGDILTMINNTPVKSPEELTATIRKQKPGDVVDVTFLRGGKSQKVKATLGKTTESFTFNSDEFKFNFEDGKPYTFTMPRVPAAPRAPYFEGEMPRVQVYGYGTPKYGMNIQDDEDRRGVKVTDVDDEGNAWKGGLREDDIITELDGEKITGVDELKEKLATKKDNPTVILKVLRDGKTENLTIKVPRKLKSASL